MRFAAPLIAQYGGVASAGLGGEQPSDASGLFPDKF